MRIEERIEERVRESLRGVVAKDGERMVHALADLSEDDARAAISYAIFVCGFIANDVHRDGPTNDQLRAMATRIVEAEGKWIDLGTADNVANFLRAAAQGDTTFTDVSKDDIIGYAFVCAGHLLTMHRLEDTHWWDYLDEIWSATEASPDPTS